MRDNVRTEEAKEENRNATTTRLLILNLSNDRMEYRKEYVELTEGDSY